MNGWDILCLIVGIIWIGSMFAGIILNNLDSIPTYNIAKVEQPDDWKKNVYLFMDSILASYGYNRSEEYMIELCQEIINRLDGTSIENCRHYRPSTDKDIVEDCDIIYGALICAFGDYGTSPRYGWLDNKIAIYCAVLLNAEIKEERTVIEMRGEE